MSHLKEESANKCFSLLREFIDESDELSSKKGIAILALKQLQKITAGDSYPGGTSPQTSSMLCSGTPRADGSPDPGGG
jgi:hypothetical protein